MLVGLVRSGADPAGWQTKCLVCLLGIALTTVLVLVVIGTVKTVRSGRSDPESGPPVGRAMQAKGDGPSEPE
jgi:hypothetical protein